MRNTAEQQYPWTNYFDLIGDLWKVEDDSSTAQELDAFINLLLRSPDFTDQTAVALAHELVPLAHDFIEQGLFGAAENALRFAASKPEANEKAMVELAHLQFRRGDHHSAVQTLLQLAINHRDEPIQARKYLQEVLPITRNRDEVFDVAASLGIDLESLPEEEERSETGGIDNDPTEVGFDRGLGFEETQPGLTASKHGHWELTPRPRLINCILLLRLCHTFEEPMKVVIRDATAKPLASFRADKGTLVAEGLEKPNCEETARVLLDVLSHGEEDLLRVEAEEHAMDGAPPSRCGLGHLAIAASRLQTDYTVRPVAWNIDKLFADDAFEVWILRQMTSSKLFVPVDCSVDLPTIRNYNRLLTHAQRIANYPGKLRAALDDEYFPACLATMDEAFWLVARRGRNLLLIRTEPRALTRLLRLLPAVTENQPVAPLAY
ncbi:hypothetical protein FIV42_25215 [Persicimonas caeni]|uniref:Tetratricopeptide repeat protein n=1 Tax=Persicimonas caeni TaxID=2292766 RepID=A0A4Y6Q075_PERCE|nr:hypothetical protein [Persicimonas caeni]QDG53922.1 hypothetical protein FIV42_25215 [Persicimonas caeni]QED35143.1 hypothetical protein FRD00_25210 [Persicimonas caeni]